MIYGPVKQRSYNDMVDSVGKLLTLDALSLATSARLIGGRRWRGSFVGLDEGLTSRCF